MFGKFWIFNLFQSIFDNRTIPKLAKTKSLQNYVFWRALIICHVRVKYGAARSPNSFEYLIQIRFETIILHLLKSNDNTMFLKQWKIFVFSKNWANFSLKTGSF